MHSMNALSLGIIGIGRVGTALGRLAHHHGVAITAIIDRNVDACHQFLGYLNHLDHKISFDINALQNAHLIMICVEDRHISTVCNDLANSGILNASHCIVHTSAVTGSDCFSLIHNHTTHTGIMHPLFSFAKHSVSISELEGIWFGIDAHGLAHDRISSFIDRLGGHIFSISGIDRVRYHTAAVFASNFLTVFSAIAGKLMIDAGLDANHARPALQSLSTSALRNVRNMTFEEALSGPIVRGDIAAIHAHLTSLQEYPLERQLYIHLTKTAAIMINSSVSRSVLSFLDTLDPHP